MPNCLPHQMITGVVADAGSEKKAGNFLFLPPPPLGGSDSLCLRAASPTFDDQATPQKKEQESGKYFPEKRI